MVQTWLIDLRNFIAQNLPSLGNGKSFGDQPLGTESEALGGKKSKCVALGPLSCAGMAGGGGTLEGPASRAF